MQTVQRLRVYHPTKPSIKQAINAKLKVLKEFGVIDDNNEYDIREQLKEAIKAHPNRDYELVLDQVAHTMIMEKLDT